MQTTLAAYQWKRIRGGSGPILLHMTDSAFILPPIECGDFINQQRTIRFMIFACVREMLGLTMTDSGCHNHQLKSSQFVCYSAIDNGYKLGRQ